MTLSTSQQNNRIKEEIIRTNQEIYFIRSKCKISKEDFKPMPNGENILKNLANHYQAKANHQ